MENAERYRCTGSDNCPGSLTPDETDPSARNNDGTNGHGTRLQNTEQLKSEGWESDTHAKHAWEPPPVKESVGVKFCRRYGRYLTCDKWCINGDSMDIQDARGVHGSLPRYDRD